MAWTLLLMDTPLNTSIAPATGLRTELTMATNRSMKFSLLEHDTISFSLPGRHWQTALVEPMLCDVLLFRDDYPVQRFRIVSADYTKSGGNLSASFTGVSYGGLLDSVIFHETDTREWTIPWPQIAIAWSVIDEAQDKEYGWLGITQGVVPAADVSRTLVGAPTTTTPAQKFFPVGKKRGEAMKDLAAMQDGFEWDIEPDRSDGLTAMRDLKWNTWNIGTRGNTAVTFVLDDGGSLSGWSKKNSGTDYANVVYATGTWPTGAVTTTAAAPVAWSPPDGNPYIGDPPPPEGRWERSVSVDIPDGGALSDAAFAAWSAARYYAADWTLELASGRWGGPSELWLGDTARLVISDGPVEIDSDVRVLELNVSVTESNVESVAVSINRPTPTYEGFRSQLERRLQSLERR